MKFEQHYSSSRANLYTVTAANGRRLLLECGVHWPMLLKALDYDLDIDACLLTHEHADHSKAIKRVMAAGIDVYSDCDTLDVLGVLDNRRAMPTPSHTILRLNGFDVQFFPVNHDAILPLGFIIRERVTDEYLFFASDSSYIRQRFNIKFSIIAIGCSYDIKILERRVDEQDINEALAKRLLTSHMEKQVTMKYLSEFCDLYKCRQIHLLHLSGDNIDKQRTKKEFENKFFIETVIK